MAFLVAFMYNFFFDYHILNFSWCRTIWEFYDEECKKDRTFKHKIGYFCSQICFQKSTITCHIILFLYFTYKYVYQKGPSCKFFITKNCPPVKPLRKVSTFFFFEFCKKVRTKIQLKLRSYHSYRSYRS